MDRLLQIPLLFAQSERWKEMGRDFDGFIQGLVANALKRGAQRGTATP